MTIKRFNLFNNVFGWLVFAVSAYTYLATIEPTASLWDCGEFISGAYRLEVDHPPGAPFHLMLYHLFMMFAPNQQWLPIIANAVSAIASAFAVLFLFWTITRLAEKILIKEKNNYSAGHVISIIGAGIVGSLAFNFSDTVWFSAVEGEVYSLSVFFTSLVFWLLLKWEYRADEPYNLKWIILIFYMMGLATGVHLLSLLVLPVMAFVFYFKKTETVTWKGIILSFIIGFVLLGVINIFVIRWVPNIGAQFDLLFVNSFNLPFGSGVLFSLVLIFGIIVFFIYYTHQRKKVYANAALIGLLFIIFGYLSYTMVIIRSTANTPINYSDPENIFNYISYINREQYGERPIFWGPDYSAQYTEFKQGRTMYWQDKANHRYKAIGHKQKPVYEKDHYMLFPRMGDSRSDQKEGYQLWSGMNEGQKKPTEAQNIKFFFRYQLGHMYWRYFAWNFIGRQNDEQGYGKIVSGHFMKGNWISGIRFLDEARLGPQKNLPYKQRVNPQYARLYFLPFLFGMLGLFFHYRRSKRDFFNVFVFFFITGILLVVYQNSPPFEPRERDYTLVGSFWAFGIWIGLGVLSLINLLLKYLKNNLVATSIFVTLVGIVAVPVLMANQEWPGHTRAHRYTTRDYGVNYLNSCAKNAVLFTNGDNDTYPLWYAQEVEGIRDDVRVCNLQLLMTDWYMDQLSRKINHSDAIKFSLKPEQITEGTRDWVGYMENPELDIDKDKYYDIQKIIDFIGSDKPEAKGVTSAGEQQNYYPTKKFRIFVDTAEVLRNGAVPRNLKNRIEQYVQWDLGKNMMIKNTILMLDMLSNNLWSRPFYFAITSGSETYLGLSDYFQQEGLAYRLTPVKRTQEEALPSEPGRINSDIMYDNMMNKFKWGNLKDPRCHIESVTRGSCTNYRNIFASLANKLIKEGKNDKAVKVLDKCLDVLPEVKVPHNINSIQLVQLYYMAGATDKGMKLAKRLSEVFIEELEYYTSCPKQFFKMADDEINRDFYGLQIIESLASQANQKDFLAKITVEKNRMETRLAIKGKNFK